MPEDLSRPVSGRPTTPSRSTEKHDQIVHALAVQSLAVVHGALATRWPQRVPPLTHNREIATRLQ